MIRVGITGGIGSGKSVVCRMIEAMGYPVYNADAEAKQLSDTNETIVSGAKALFGNSIYCEGKLDRKRVGSLVFADAKLLERLNSIIHPVVAAHFEAWVLANNQHRLVFKEAAILFESGAYKQVDKTVAVWAPDVVRIARVRSRDGVSENEVRGRIANQMPQHQLVGKVSYVIKNNGEELLLPQVVNLINSLLEI
ncbi:MAG: dephospho-CoA kinase [Tenuifilaceae bacterium]|nr:dephospho-CoA kinase [Tenuifilaceae bacterium]